MPIAASTPTEHKPKPIPTPESVLKNNSEVFQHDIQNVNTEMVEEIKENPTKPTDPREIKEKETKKKVYS
jgi:hypothetical protein